MIGNDAVDSVVVDSVVVDVDNKTVIKMCGIYVGSVLAVNRKNIALWQEQSCDKK